MRLQQRKTALESTQPLVLWCILALPALALVIGVTVDYTSAFDVQQFHIPSRNCLNGCNLSYTIDNRFGIIPLNYLQIAAIIDVLPSKSSDSSVPLQWNGVVPDGQQLSCPQGWQVEIFKTSKRSDDFDGKSFCINFWNFRSNYFGSLTGVSLDGPSAHMDGHLQAIDAIIRVPPIGLHYESDITVQFVLVSPVFSDIRTIVQIIFIVLTIIVCIAFYRAVYIAKQSDPTKNVPEQDYCKALLIFLLFWLNPIAVLRFMFAPISLFSEAGSAKEISLLSFLSYAYLLERISCDVGFQGILFCFLCITGGICSGIQFGECEAPEEAPADNPEIIINRSRCANESSQSAHYDSAIQIYPWHHSKSPRYFAFLSHKILFLALSYTLVLFKYSLRFPTIPGIEYDTSNSQAVVDSAYNVLSIIVSFCTITWLYKVYQAFSACVYRFSAPQLRSLYLGAGNSSDLSGFDVYARLAVCLVSFQISILILLGFAFIVYWLQISGWFSGIYHLLSSPLVKSFYESGDNDYSATMVFSNTSFSQQIFQNYTLKSIFAEQFAQYNQSTILDFVSFLGRICTISWVNMFRFWSLGPSLAQIMICCIMTYSVVYSFFPVGVRIREIIPIGSKICLGISESEQVHHELNIVQDNVYYKSLSFSRNQVQPNSFLLDSRLSSYGAIEQVESGPNSSQSAFFCLETACFLLECSWQSYFKPQAQVTGEKDLTPGVFESSELFGTKGDIASLDQQCAAYRDLNQLNLQLVWDVASIEYQLRSFIAIRASENQIVIAFRGTYSMSNVKTDLTFNQTMLPNLKLGSGVSRRSNGSSYLNINTLWRSVFVEFEATKSSNPFDVDNIEGTHHNVGFDEVMYSAKPAPKEMNPSRDSRWQHTREEISWNSIWRGSANRIKEGAVSFSSLFSSECCSQGVRVHAGFWGAYSAIRREIFRGVMLSILELTLADYSYNPLNIQDIVPKISICGHSLGGALATLAALDLSLNIEYVVDCLGDYLRNEEFLAFVSNIRTSILERERLAVPIIEIYTFGAPRVGNAEFKQFFEKKVKNSFRVEVNGDMICRTPVLAGYRHAAVVPVLLLDSLSTHVASHASHQNVSWNGVDGTGGGTHLTTLLVQPSYSQFFLIRKHTASPEFHSLIAYRNYLESMFSAEERRIYYSKYKAVNSETCQINGAKLLVASNSTKKSICGFLKPYLD